MEKLTFTRSGDAIAISASYTDATAMVGRDELEQALRAFHERVTRDVLARYPGLTENPDARPYLALDPA